MVEETGYLGNPRLKRVREKIRWTKEMLLEFEKCKNDKIYFIETYVKINDPDEGLVNFNLYPYQKKVCNVISENRFSIIKFPRQSGKSTTVGADTLHEILFKEGQTVGIFANKASSALEILSRIQLMYEYLPKFLQQGIVEWNKGNIKLENRSKIYAFATSPDSGRSHTYTRIILDEFAFVPKNIASEFYEAVYPTITKSKKSRIIIISTPNGTGNLYYKLWTDASAKKNSYVPISIAWNDVPGRDEEWKIETIKNIGESRWQQEFEAQFLGTTNTLITAAALSSIVTIEPIKVINRTLKIYHEPEPEHIYAAIVDTAEGTGNDYSVVNIIDISTSPYEVSAIYRDNLIAPSDLPAKLLELCKYYNDPLVLIELNSIGNQVADKMAEEFDYEQLLYTTKYQDADRISGGFSKNSKRGLRTTTKTKKVGCAQLKKLIEGNQININDFNLFSELTSFVRDKNSYAAESGETDDIVMTLVIFAWLTSQLYFQELTDEGLMKSAKDKNKLLAEDDYVPFGLIDDGVNDYGTEIDDDGYKL